MAKQGDPYEHQIEAATEEVRHVVKADPTLSRNLALLRGVGPKGSPGIADVTPKALAAFAGPSPSKHSAGSSVRRPGTDLDRL